MIYPPSGWLFGFPKSIDAKLWHSFTTSQKENWFYENGYPQEMIDMGRLSYCRFWYKDEENES